MSKGKKFSSMQAVVFASSFIAIIIGMATASGGFSKNQSLHVLLIQGAKEINRDIPQVLDDYTRLDSASVVSDSILQYNYTLTQYEKYEINKDTADKYIKKNSIEEIKANPDMQALRERKVTFSYHYRDKNGEEAYAFKVTPEFYSGE